MMLEYTLQNDGTMDTVVEVCCTDCGKTWTETFDTEYASYYRNDDGVMVDLKGLMEGFDRWCEDCE